MISIVIIIHNIPRQARNTLFTLSTKFQKNILPEDYEVVVVENSSGNILGEEVALSFGKNFRYIFNEEKSPSPARAINIGIAHAKGDIIGLIIDGARMITPRVIEYTKLAFQLNANALVCIPSYHLGTTDQKEHKQSGHSEETEIQALKELDWENHGYRLFKYACFSPSNRKGYLQPMQESSVIFASKKAFEKIGGADEQFNLPGGGSLNLHMYRQLGMLQEHQLFVLPGEGSFHQFHHGVTTSECEERDKLIKRFKEQLDSLWDGRFQSLRREPVLLGSVTYLAQPFLGKSTEFAQTRFSRLAANQKPYWEDDAVSERYTENQTSDTDENKNWFVEPIKPPKFWV